MIGSVREREPSSVPPRAPGGAISPKSSNGFPSVVHRSKDARGKSQFAKARASAHLPDRAAGAPSVSSDSLQPNLVSSLKGATAEPGQSHAVDPELPGDAQKMMLEVGAENDARIDAMSNEEVREAQREVMERLRDKAGDVAALLRRRRMQREGRAVEPTSDVLSRDPTALTDTAITTNPTDASSEVYVVDSPDRSENWTMNSAQSSVPGAASMKHNTDFLSPENAVSLEGSTSTPSTVPSTPHSRRLRFADVTASDIHVYPSQPPSPKPVHLLMAPPPGGDPDAQELEGPALKKMRFHLLNDDSCASELKQPDESAGITASSSSVSPLSLLNETYPEEGTPEDIRRRFFPSEDASKPALEWMSTPGSDVSTSGPRFDLRGEIIPLSLQQSLPTHLGLHHTASTLAGYTLDDLLHLSRSRVTAQRATVLSVLAKIARKLGRGDLDATELGFDARERILSAGLAALGERGSLGARAVEVVWEAVVGWDESYMHLSGVELWHEIPKEKRPAPDDQGGIPRPNSSRDTISRIPLEEVVPYLQQYFTYPPSYPPNIISQVLAILYRLAVHSISHATIITGTAGLISTLMSATLLEGSSGDSISSACNPMMITLLRGLAVSSRANALALTPDVPDALLRFVALLPGSYLEMEEQENRCALLTETLSLYAVLAKYGLYTQVASAAQELFASLSGYVSSYFCKEDVPSNFHELTAAWLALCETWIVCATDPHMTTPPHDILWSQVNAWSWGDELLDLAEKMDDVEPRCLVSLWSAAAAYAEGAAINGIRGGELEKAAVLSRILPTVQGGSGKTSIDAAIDDLSSAFDRYDGLQQSQLASVMFLEALAKCAAILNTVVRLSLSVFTSMDSTSDPLGLPLASLARLTTGCLVSRLWDDVLSVNAPPGSYVHLRPLTSLLVNELKLSARLQTMSANSWFVKGLRVLPRLLPGDEEHALWILSELSSRSDGIAEEFDLNVSPHLLAEDGMRIIMPFYAHEVRPDPEQWIAPYVSTPDSIAAATTTVVPSLSSLSKTLELSTRTSYGLPFKREWLAKPLNDLLRSGSQSALDHIPVTWDASKTEIVACTLQILEVFQELMREDHGDEALTREEIVFTCMKVFMLEHNQMEGDVSEDVFRDEVVSRKMLHLLAPYRPRPPGSSSPSFCAPSSETTRTSLETVALPFLGPGVPFYQFYTDFIALYEAVSFAHPIFAQMLLPPLSQRYPVDYRKLLWADQSTTIRTVRTPVEDIVAESADEYLWPLETDSEQLSLYLRALVGQSVHGFLHTIALHHVSCNIWSTSHSDDTVQQRRKQMLMVLLRQNRKEIAREVLLYGPSMTNPAHPLLTREEKVKWARSWGAADVADRLSSCLDP